MVYLFRDRPPILQPKLLGTEAALESEEEDPVDLEDSTHESDADVDEDEEDDRADVDDEEDEEMMTSERKTADTSLIEDIEVVSEGKTVEGKESIGLVDTASSKCSENVVPDADIESATVNIQDKIRPEPPLDNESRFGRRPTKVAGGDVGRCEHDARSSFTA